MTIGFDILGGFNTRAAEEREVIRQQQARRDQTELKILEALANSPDPEIRDRAIAGMLNFADPRKKRKGLSGFLGETEGHPALPAIAALLGPQGMNIDPGEVRTGLPGFSQTPTAGAPGGQVRTPPAPAGQAAGAATTPTQGGPIALPTGIGQVGQAMPMPAAAAPPAPPPPTSTGQVAAQAPPAQVGLPTPPPSFADTRKAPRGASVSVKRRRVLSSGPYEDRLRGLVEGYEYYTGKPAPPEMVEAVAMELAGFSPGGGAGGAGLQSVAGQLPDGSPAFGVFDKRVGGYVHPAGHPQAGQPIPGFTPRTSTGSKSYGSDREAISLEAAFGGKPYAQQDPETRERINQEAIRRAGDLSYERGTGTGRAAVERGLTQQQLFQATSDLKTDWQKAALPAKELKKQLYIMQQGLAAAKAGDRSAGDQAVLVTFQKMLDPLSVVREAEYFRSAAGLSLLQRAQGAYEHLLQGGAKVPLPELEGYARLAEQIATAVEADAIAQRDRIAGQAQRWGVNALDVFGADAPPPGMPTLGTPPPAPTAPPAPPAPAQAVAPPPGPGGATPTANASPAAPPAAPAASGSPSSAPAAVAPPPMQDAPGPPRAYRQPSAPKIGDDVINPKTGLPDKIVAIHPRTGRGWLASMGPVPESWKR